MKLKVLVVMLHCNAVMEPLQKQSRKAVISFSVGYLNAHSVKNKQKKKKKNTEWLSGH